MIKKNYMNNILVVAVHPDDETLGCGGTLLHFKSQGSSIHWLVVTAIYSQKKDEELTLNSLSQIKSLDVGNVSLRSFTWEQVERRSQELRQVRQAYDFDSVHELCLPAMCLDQLPMSLLVSRFSEIMHLVKPDTVILPFKSDVHSDHRVCFEAAYSCTKSFRYPFVKKVMMMETLSETEFAPSTKENMFCPNVFVDISQFVSQKISIMSLYTGEIAPPPFPRSVENIKSLSTYRGAMCGVEAAESFMLLRDCIA